jgi:hypothetical protein
MAHPPARRLAQKMPRRHEDLFRRIANFQALHAAARRAIKGKRKKPGAASFFANLEGELLALVRERSRVQSSLAAPYIQLLMNKCHLRQRP